MNALAGRVGRKDPAPPLRSLSDLPLKARPSSDAARDLLKILGGDLLWGGKVRPFGSVGCSFQQFIHDNILLVLNAFFGLPEASGDEGQTIQCRFLAL